MKKRCVSSTRHANPCDPLINLMVVVLVLMCFASPAVAFDTMLGGDPVTVSGYVKQGAAYGVGDGNQFDNKEGFQSFLTQALLELQYQPRSDLKFFLSGKGNVDWAYPVFSDNSQWRDKQFNDSRNRLFVLNDWQDVLNEAHVTYAKGDVFLRVGKQIVAWGQTDGFRLMDQINPLDQRRGLGDVSFENSIIPVWLVRAEYQQPVVSSWLQELSYQFIFNPNVKYRGSEGMFPDGNDVYGIWNLDMPGPHFRYVSAMTPGGPVGWVPASVVSTLPPFMQATAGSLTESNIGSFDDGVEEPGNFSPDGFKYAGKITTSINDFRITMNGFYGRDNNWVFAVKPDAPRLEVSPWDGRIIIHPRVEAYYPIFKFVGATMSKDLSGLKSEFLGGVSPVLRVEAMYAFDSTFGKYTTATDSQDFEKHDEVRWAVGLDWKLKIPPLNDMAYFMVSPQIYNRRIMNYKNDGYLFSSTDPHIRENTWTTTLLISTSYFHNKIQPSFFWLHDWSNRAWFVKPELSYEYNSQWKYTVGAVVVHGEKETDGLWCLRHKDNVYGTVAYRF